MSATANHEIRGLSDRHGRTGSDRTLSRRPRPQRRRQRLRLRRWPGCRRRGSGCRNWTAIRRGGWRRRSCSATAGTHLYQAKAAGRNRILAASPRHIKIIDPEPAFDAACGPGALCDKGFAVIDENLRSGARQWTQFEEIRECELQPWALLNETRKDDRAKLIGRIVGDLLVVWFTLHIDSQCS